MQSDPEWSQLLNRVRMGQTTRGDLHELHSLVLADSNVPDFSEAPWKDTILVTARHAVRTRWNSAALRKTCEDSHVPLVRILSDDSINGLCLSPVQREIVRIAEEKRKQRIENMLEKNLLPREIELAVGAKVVITENIATQFHMVNGARGVVTNILLDPRDEGLIAEGGEMVPRYLPLCVVVQLNDVREEWRNVPMFPGLGPREVPIVPAERHMRIQEPVGPNRPPATRTVVRKQLPLTTAYGLTDYRSQGQTIHKLLLDLKSPPGNHALSPFNLYVALSRSHGREDIRILREFEDKPFYFTPDPDLLAEDKRLDFLDQKTRIWWESLGRQRSK